MRNLHPYFSQGVEVNTTLSPPRKEQPLWRSFSQALREEFGERVVKLMLDAGFTCPNRDGTKSRGGCTFCDAHGSGSGAAMRAESVIEQLEREITRASGNRFGAKRYIAYFQAYTNTYAPIERLRCLYDAALARPEVVGLSIGTRADSVPDDVLDLIAEYSRRTYLWLELGLQSTSNETLHRVNRAETVEQFVDAVERAHARNIRVCAHVIFGFSWETRERMLEAVDLVAGLGVEGIKFHSLYLVPGTPLHDEVIRDRLPLFDQETYACLVADALKRLPADTVIHRLTGDPPFGIPALPEWTRDKTGTLSRIESALRKSQTYQGSEYDPARAADVVDRYRLHI